MKWRKAYNYYLGSSLAMLIMLFVMAGIVIYPAANKILTIKKEIAAEKASLENKLNMGLNAKKIKEDLIEVERKLSLLDSIFIPQDRELDLLSSIEDLAAANNVEIILKPDFKGVSLPGGIIRTPLAISARGGFSNIMSFLNGLDGTGFFYISDQITMAKGDKETFSLAVAGHVYVRAPSKN